MKVQLIVVQGKPEGKTIPLNGPVFRIGRGETCNLRPNSEQVSREHAEFQLSADQVVIRDLKSRNGTLVNGKAITGPTTLKDRDLVQIGPLTFAVSIQGAPATAAKAAPARSASPDDVSTDDIDSWLIADSKNPTPERPSGVYTGDTITIAAFKDDKSKSAAPPKAPTPPPAEAEEEYERLPEGEGDTQDELDALSESPADSEGPTEEWVDESNPFYVKKEEPPKAPAKPAHKDTSDAAGEILRKMMERRRQSR